MIKEDRTLTTGSNPRYERGDDPATLLRVRHTIALAAAGLIGAGCILALFLVPRETTHVWNLACTGLIAASITAAYAGGVEGMRMLQRQLARAVRAADARAEQAELARAQAQARQLETLRRLTRIERALERSEQRDATIMDRLDEADIRLTRGEHHANACDARHEDLASKVVDLRAREDRLAGTVSDILGDDLRQRRSG